MAFVRTLVAVSLSLSFVACGGHGKKKKIKNIFIHGDPDALLADATPVTTSIVTPTTLDDFKGFSLFGGAYFQQYSPLGTATTAEEGNEAASGEEEEGGKLDSYEFSQSGDQYIYSSPGTEDAPQFVFINQDGHLVLIKMRFNSEVEIDVEPVHYSMAPHKDAFSLLSTSAARSPTTCRRSTIIF
jgi:hypothetical protein